jgi:branched-chain amino acid aminotransferase
MGAMTSLKSEWPGFAYLPEEDALTLSRPESQELASWVWYDGEIREAERVQVHYYANALHYGTAVFEGIRCYPTDAGPALFRPRDHVERMLNSARLYGMRVPYGADELIQAALEVARKNGLAHVYLRPLAFFGHGPIDLKPKSGCPVHVLIATRGLGTFLGEGALRNGIRMMVSSWRRFHHSMVPTMAKASGHYANSVLAAHEALDHGCDDAILLNQDGSVSGATGGNVFFLKGGVLYTNDESSSIVPGITRDSVLTLAREHDIPVIIRAFTREDLARADEVFLTGTAYEVTPLRELDGTEYPTGKRTFAALLQRAYLRAASGKSPGHADWLVAV